MLAAFTQSWSGIIAICLIYAALCDISVRTIPNRISLAVAALAVPFRISGHDLGQAVIVALFIFAILTFAWSLRLLGGGDVKLWTACSLLVPPEWAAQGLFSLRVILIGGAVAMVYLLLRLAMRPGRRQPPGRPASPRDQAWLKRIWRAEQWRARHGGSIPYGVAIALSALFTFWPRVKG